MLIVLPDWTMELEEKLDKVIKDIAAKNHIDLMMIDDSKAIDEAKSSIMHALLRLYDDYKVEERIRLEEFVKDINVKDIKKAENKKKRSKK